MNVRTLTAEGRKAHRKSITLKNNKCPLLMETWKTVVERCKIKMPVSACEFKLVKFPALSDDEVLFCIFFLQTYIGLVVISINPYKKLKIFGPDTIQEYRSRNVYETKPHAWVFYESTSCVKAPDKKLVHEVRLAVIQNMWSWSICRAACQWETYQQKANSNNTFLSRSASWKKRKAVAPITRGWSLITKTIVDN